VRAAPKHNALRNVRGHLDMLDCKKERKGTKEEGVYMDLEGQP
jgi:hypothetical protein